MVATRLIQACTISTVSLPQGRRPPWRELLHVLRMWCYIAEVGPVHSVCRRIRVIYSYLSLVGADASECCFCASSGDERMP